MEKAANDGREMRGRTTAVKKMVLKRTYNFSRVALMMMGMMGAEKWIDVVGWTGRESWR